MTVEYIRYKITSERREEFINAYENAAEEMDGSEFCLAYELTECEEEQGVFILRIEWTSTEDHLQGFRRSDQFPPFLQKIRPYYNDILEMRHYQLTKVVKRK